MTDLYIILHSDISGKIIPTPSIQIGDERYGFGVGATRIPVYRSNSHYKGDPTMEYDENLQRMAKEDIEKKRKEDNHKMSEHFWEVREEIEDIDTILVRPEGWERLQ